MIKLVGGFPQCSFIKVCLWLAQRAISASYVAPFFERTFLWRLELGIIAQ